MKKRIIRITAALAAAALLAGCGSISSKDGGDYTTEAAAQESYNYDSAAGGTDSSLVPENAAEAATDETAQKIIYNASLSMESTDFDTTREALLAAVEANRPELLIKPIFGCEAYFITDDQIERGTKQRRYHLILLAKNETGYVNLMKMMSEAAIDQFYNLLTFDGRPQAKGDGNGD